MKKFLLLLLPLTLWILGFLWFISSTPSHIKDDNIYTDAIIVLTGGKGRIIEGIRLLSENKAKKMLISGVGQNANLNDLKTMSDELAMISLKPYQSRITLGHYATNTKQNAHEAAMWMEFNNFKSLRLVTSSYHINRSVAEFKSVMGNIEIIPHPVFTSNFKLSEWWKFPGTAKLLFLEYNKLIASYLTDA
jgi:uncharacterized SAM-binding protein YcdF (DUF218 family)